MADIKERIRKLLALGTSPNENEARAALLKAKRLMMEHKISESEINEKNTKLVHLAVEDVKWTSDSGDVWVTKLCEVIADNYMCATAWGHTKGRRTYTLEVTGLGEDPEVCADVIRFAVGMVRNTARAIHRRYGGDAKTTRHSYAEGFILGLEIAFENQRQEHAEWGLVEVKPKAVEGYEKSLKSRSVKAKVSNSTDVLARMEGVNDGSKFNARAVIE